MLSTVQDEETAHNTTSGRYIYIYIYTGFVSDIFDLLMLFCSASISINCCSNGSMVSKACLINDRIEIAWMLSIAAHTQHTLQNDENITQ